MKNEQQIQLIEQQFSFLRNNYRSMFWNAVNPFEGNSALSQIVNVAKNTLMPALTAKESGLNISPNQTLVEVAGILLAKLIGRITHKKGKNREPDTE